MSIIIEFFLAPDPMTAAAAILGGPDAIGEYDVVHAGNFDVWSALEEWGALLLGAAGGAAGEDLDTLEILAQVDESAVMVMEVPPRLQTALASGSPEVFRAVLKRWAAEQASARPGGSAEKPELYTEALEDLLDELADMARKAAATGQGVYCWTC